MRSRVIGWMTQNRQSWRMKFQRMKFQIAQDNLLFIINGCFINNNYIYLFTLMRDATITCTTISIMMSPWCHHNVNLWHLLLRHPPSFQHSETSRHGWSKCSHLTLEMPQANKKGSKAQHLYIHTCIDYTTPFCNSFGFLYHGFFWWKAPTPNNRGNRSPFGNTLGQLQQQFWLPRKRIQTTLPICWLTGEGGGRRNLIWWKIEAISIISKYIHIIFRLTSSYYVFSSGLTSEAMDLGKSLWGSRWNTPIGGSRWIQGTSLSCL